MDVPTVTLIVLAIQVVIYGLMLHRMKEANKAIKISADAAKDSSDAAKKAADHVVITERAAVFVKSVSGTPPYTIGALGTGYPSVDSKVVFTLKNFGRGIADSVKLIGALTSRGAKDFLVEELPPTIIPPKGKSSWSTKPLRDWISHEELKGINAGWPILQYKIDVTYADDFKRHTYHCEGKYEPAIQRFSITASSEGEAAD